MTAAHNKNLNSGKIKATGDVWLGDNINNFTNNPFQIPKIISEKGAIRPITFLGRTKALDTLREQLQNSGLVVMNGEGGIGKTTLAVAYWEQHQNDYKHFAWFYCEAGIMDTLRSNLPGRLGIQEQFNKVEAPSDQHQLLKSELGNLGNQCLLVLDNANSEKDLESFIQTYQGLSCHVLITSWRTKVSTTEYTVQALALQEAKTLFKANYEEHTPAFDHLLEQFIAAVGGNTLCIELFSKNLKELAGLYTLSQLLDHFKQKGILLGENSFEIQTGYVQKRTATTDEIIGLLYDFAKLEVNEALLLLQIALFPAENYSPVLLALLFNIQEPIELKKYLDTIARKGWLLSEQSVYRLSPVVQHLLLSKNQSQRSALTEEFIIHIDSLIDDSSGHLQLNSDLEVDPVKLLQLGTHLLEQTTVVCEEALRLYLKGIDYSRSTGNILQSRALCEYLLKIAKAKESKLWEALAEERLGSLFSDLGNLADAQYHFAINYKLFQELHLAFPDQVYFKHGVAVACERLGEAYTALGDTQKAVAFFERCYTIRQELHLAFPDQVDFKHGVAVACSKLGETYTTLGDTHKAIAFFERFYTISQELHLAFPDQVNFKNGLAVACSKLGETYTELGDTQKALSFFERDYTIIQELHLAFPDQVNFKRGVAVACERLGEAYTALGDTQKALSFFERSYTISQELHLAFPDQVNFKNGVAVTCEKLGEAYRALGDTQKALAFFERDYTISQELQQAFPDQVNFKNNFALACAKLGDTYTKLGDTQKAVEFFERAYTIIQELHLAFPDQVNFKNGVAVACAQLGYTHTALGDTQKARVYFQQAETLWQALVQQAPLVVSYQQLLTRVKADLANL